MSDMIEVGTHDWEDCCITGKRKVSKLNNELFLLAKKVMHEDKIEFNRGMSHMGWCDVGIFIDEIEKRYKLKEK